MVLIRHLPRSPGVLAPGKELQLLTEAVAANALYIERKERERLKAEIRIHTPEVPKPAPDVEVLPRFTPERRQQLFQEIGIGCQRFRDEAGLGRIGESDENIRS